MNDRDRPAAPWHLPLAAAFVLPVLSAGCDGDATVAAPVPAVGAVVGGPPAGMTAAEPAGADATGFARQELEQLGSPFTRETVLELNAIVARSLAAVEEFDAVRKAGADDADRAAAERRETLAALSDRAGRARSDLTAAAARLRDRGEPHNEAILAAMVRFANDVDGEIREELGRSDDGSPADPTALAGA